MIRKLPAWAASQEKTEAKQPAETGYGLTGRFVCRLVVVCAVINGLCKPRLLSAPEHPVCADRHIQDFVQRLIAALCDHLCGFKIIAAQIKHGITVFQNSMGAAAVAVCEL